MSKSIQVKNLSKIYRIGSADRKHDTFIDYLFHLIKLPITNFKNISSLSNFKKNEKSDNILYALDNVSFEINKGELYGVIGANGAGKSTLLKILSRITWPSSGEVQIQGKVASLLEVGTGFHLDLTGKENVYLNGTYLGMTKKEIDNKYEEIVSFSNVGKFINTPVKRYSTGMLMRLAFSVAAFLDTEVLLIDEVLAVGDASFQKKCLGKMDELSKSGKTVLFVSHQIPALRSLCEKGLLFDRGELIFQGEINECIDQHLKNQKVNAKKNTKMFKPHDSIDIKNFRAEIINNHMKIFYDYKLKQTVNNLCMGFVIIDMNGNKLLNSFDIETFRDRGVGEYKSVFSLTINALRPGDYKIKSIIIFKDVEWYEKENVSISINIPGSDNNIYNNGLLKRIGEWEILKK